MPNSVNLHEIQDQICKIEGVDNVHHVHVWSIDGYNHCATMHIVVNEDVYNIKKTIRTLLKQHGIEHATLEIEDSLDETREEDCCLISHSNRHLHSH